MQNKSPLMTKPQSRHFDLFVAYFGAEYVENYLKEKFDNVDMTKITNDQAQYLLKTLSNRVDYAFKCKHFGRKYKPKAAERAAKRKEKADHLTKLKNSDNIIPIVEEEQLVAE